MKLKMTKGRLFIDNKEVHLIVFKDGSNLILPTHDNDELILTSDHSYNEVTIVGDKNHVIQGKNIISPGSSIVCNGDLRLGDG